MKRLVAILLTVLVLISLTACTMGTDGTQLGSETSATEATKAPQADINDYKKDFEGMQSYLKELELISSEEKNITKTQADIIGAENGVRYKIDATNFVEFYEINTEKMTDEASAMIDAFSSGNTYKVLDIEEVKGEVSTSGQFVMLYPANSTYDYSEISEEFKKF